MKLHYRRGGNLDVDFSEVHVAGTTGNYETMYNKPSINSVELVGALTAKDLGLGTVYYNTTDGWALQRDLVTEVGAVYIYSDVGTYTDEMGQTFPVAGLKIGDGTSYLIDMPFVNDSASAVVFDHVANRDIHITDDERRFWNNKVSSYVDDSDEENLVLSKTHFTIDGVLFGG